MDRINLIPIIFLLLLTCLNAQSQEESFTFSPATFPDKIHETTARIKFPDVEGDFRYLVLCSRELRSNGRFSRDNDCWPNNEEIDKRIETSIARAIYRTKMNPAMIDGENENVFFQYSVEFVQESGNKQIYLHPHHFNNVNQLGSNYTAPQKYSIPTLNYRNCDRSTFFNNKSAFDLDIVIQLVVDKYGSPRHVEPAPGQELNFKEGSIQQKCLSHQLDRNKQAKYIPAFKDGQAVTADYAEAFFFRQHDSPRISEYYFKVPGTTGLRGIN